MSVYSVVRRLKLSRRWAGFAAAALVVAGSMTGLSAQIFQIGLTGTLASFGLILGTDIAYDSSSHWWWPDP
jgi:hypothetical protein